jgi:hypothetical protein
MRPCANWARAPEGSVQYLIILEFVHTEINREKGAARRKSSGFDIARQPIQA